MSERSADSGNAHWTTDAIEQLLAHRGNSPGWGYRPQGDSFVEPTVLACLGLLAQEDSSPAVQSLVHDSAAWIAEIQQSDGSVGLSNALPAPRWPTALALLLWSAINSHEQARNRARNWLLNEKGTAFPRIANSPVGHDTTLVGWPWVADTHSWLEPTCLAILSLTHGNTDLVQSPRVAEGLTLIENRAIESGGWNYGNKAAFGTPLRPRPAPTGWALLAMTKTGTRPAVIDPAIDYLLKELPRIRSAQSLCWGLLGLLAWNVDVPEKDQWLRECFKLSLQRSDPAVQLAYLLLAASGSRALQLMDIQQRKSTADE